MSLNKTFFISTYVAFGFMVKSVHILLIRYIGDKSGKVFKNAKVLRVKRGLDVILPCLLYVFVFCCVIIG